MITQPEEAKIETLKKVSLQNERPVSRRAIISIITGIVLLLILVHIGFSKTYIRHFPGFADYVRPNGRKIHFTWVMHFHGMMMMGWVLMLLLQPILILKGKIKWHRRVGTLSYVLAPLVLLSMWLITRGRFLEFLGLQGYTAAVANLSLNVPNIVFFALFYFLAIYYKRQPHLHMRFMCSTAFPLIGPGLARIFTSYLEFDREYAASTVRIITVLIAAAITISDSVRTKRISPFALVLGLMLLHAILWELRYTPFGQSVWGVVAKMF
ncbi:MAG TPA: hypothetical protein VF476_17225 [Chitinophagaceae bacterium]